MKNKKFAVILSGCGVFDGAEIHESVMTILAIVKNGGSYEIFAPNIMQHHVVNHITGEEMNEKRNVLIESARIARGKIKDLKDFNVNNFDAVIFPGGFGVAKNLSSFAFDGTNCSVNEEIEKVIKDVIAKEKPIGALCISPVIIAKIINGATVTIGQDKGTAEAIKNMGGKHENTNNREISIDKKYKIVTNPCYMLDANIIDIQEGTDNVIKEILNFL